MKRFLGEKSGNIAIMFGLTGIVMLSAAGGALDWSRAMVTKTRLGTALDAAALAIGTTSGLSQNQLEAMAQQYFTANYPPNTIGTPSPVHVVVDGQRISFGHCERADDPVEARQHQHVGSLGGKPGGARRHETARCPRARQYRFDGGNRWQQHEQNVGAQDRLASIADSIAGGSDQSR
jgi:hypothetical protein